MDQAQFVSKINAYFAAAIASKEGISKEKAHQKIEGLFSSEEDQNHPFGLWVADKTGFPEVYVNRDSFTIYGQPKSLQWLTDAIKPIKFLQVGNATMYGEYQEWAIENGEWWPEEVDLLYGEWDVY